MRISLINLNLVGTDAIGQCLLNQARYSLRRGDQVQFYTQHPPYQVPDDLAALTRVVSPINLDMQRDEHFVRSDLYVYHYPARYPLIDSISFIDRGAVIFYFHNVTPPDLWGSIFERDTLTDSLVRVASLAALADLCVTDSEFNADQLVSVHGIERARIRVLPLAVSFDRFMPGPKDDALLQRYQLHGRRIILFVGRMAGNKRIDLLVEALTIVQQTVPNATLLLVGDDRGNPALQENVAKARARASELGVTPHVIITGPVDDQMPYYRLADVYATASLHEGFGVPLIEAMASGIPVVASKATAHPWVMGDAGLLAEPNDAVDLAKQLVRVLMNDQLHGELVQLGLERVKEFSLERYEAGWGKIVAEATEWLPRQPYPRPRSQLSSLASSAAGSKALLHDESRWLVNAADVMQRDYVVHSNAPVIGPLIAWIRRNLTSHLREPYLDPTLERQVAFNRQLVQMLQAHLEQTARQLENNEIERKKLSEQMERITVAVDKTLEELISFSALTAKAQQRLQALRQGLMSDPTSQGH